MKSMIMSNRTSARRLRLESLEERTLLAVTAGLAEPAAALAAPTGAANWVVNTTDDPSSWDTADSVVSLREAIGRAQTGDTITFDESLADSTITLSGSQLEITKSITIDASAVGGITIDANSQGRVLSVSGGTADVPVELIGLTITGGSVSGSDYGAGIYNTGKLTMTACTVAGNSAGTSGGGISNDDGILTMTNCTVMGNSASGYGGGIENYDGTLTMTACTVVGNSAGYGGGIANSYYGTLTMVNCAVTLNTATWAGGICGEMGEVTMTNCAVTMNTAKSYAGIWSSSVMRLYNCTVAGNNSTSDSGCGIAVFDRTYLYNTIVAQNTANGSESDVTCGSNVSLYAHNTLSSYTGWASGSSNNLTYKSSQPLFTDAAGGDYTLAENSQAIDKGKNNYISGYDTDLAGNPRIYNFVVDIGAYEYLCNDSDIETPSTVVTTNLDIVNQTDNLISLREAIFYAAAGETVTFDQSMAGKTITLDKGELKIESSVSVDASSIGGIMITAVSKSRVFSVSSWSGVPVELVGLTITGGSVSGSDDGGGIYNTGHLKLTDCNITGNRANDCGGAAYNSGTLTLTNCTVTANSSGGDGGAFYNSSGGIDLTNCTVAMNFAMNGGAFYNRSSATLTNCTVAENSARYGGGIYQNSYTTKLYNTIIARNTAGYSGGDIYCSSGSVYACNTLSSYTGWSGDSKGCQVYDPSQPLFTDAEAGDFTLVGTSSAIDRGNNEYIAGYETDLADNLRIFAAWRETPTVDIGAFEYQGQADPPEAETPSLVVTTGQDTVDEYDGLISLREAVTLYASEGDTVTFAPELSSVFVDETIEITKGITIDASSIGGMTIDCVDYGTNMSNIFLVTGGSSAAAVELVSLTLSWSPGINNSGTLVMTDCSVQSGWGDAVTNTGSVLMTGCAFYGIESRAVFNGDTGQMTMLRCNVSDCQGGTDGDLYGGAVYNVGTLTMTDCSVNGNFRSAGFYSRGDIYGGGIYNGGTLTMTNCSVSNNIAPQAMHCYGAGIYNSGTLTMTSCSVSGNDGYLCDEVKGIGIYSYGYLEMTNCKVTGNAVEEGYGDCLGGGIYISGYGDLVNCEVTGNAVKGGDAYGDYFDYNHYLPAGDGAGGGIYISGNGDLVMTNCTVAGNSAVGGKDYEGYYDYYRDEYYYANGVGIGYGIYINSGSVSFYNSIIAQNTASSSGNDIYRYSGSLYAYNTLSSFTGWTESENCLTYDSSRLFTDAAGGDYSLAVISSSQAIDKGNNDYISGYETDLAGNPRIYNNGTVDLGAYECQSNLSELEPASTVVTTSLDVSDPTDNLISLREAIFYAAAADTITFDASLAGQTITFGGKELVIDKTVSIDASSIGGITVDAGGKSRVFSVSGGTADTPVELIALTITGGYANVSDSNDGGGIYNTGRLKLTDCTVTGNRVSDDGGAVYNTGTLTLTNCEVTGNSASDDGGAFYNYGSSAVLTLTNCTVTGNRSSDVGGGIYIYSGTLTMTNCTVSGNNSSGYYGGGIYSYASSATVNLYNTIIAQNTASRSGNDVYRSSGSLYAYNTLSSYTGWTESENCLTYDSSQPLFKDEAGGDYTLAAGSLAINHGNNDYISGYETDLAGNPRIFDGTVDIGAYEYQEETIFETPSTVVTTNLDVVDPTDNLISLREAIFYAAAADTITFDALLAGQTITLAGKELVIDKTVSIDASSIGGITVDADGKSRVFSVSGGTADVPVELIALTITGGYANVSDSNDGGGIYNTGHLKLTDCNITGNRVSDDGGAVYNSGTLTLTNCEVTGNSSGDCGGAVYNYGSSAVLTLTSCTVSGNSAGYGGGIYNYFGTLMMTNCTVTGNSSSHGGGGIMSNGSTLTLTSCTVTGNSASHGGGIYNFNSLSSASAYLYNTIIAQNTASRSGNDVYRDSGSLYAYNTLSSFTDWTESENCLTYDSSQPLFTDAAGGDYTLAENSQAIDKGNNAYVETETDLAGNPRIAGGIVDLGAYEYRSGGGQTEQLAAPTISTGSRGVYVSHGANRHQIQWSAVANASGYELAYSADGVRWTTVSASGTGAVVTGLTYGADVTYRVRALGTGSYTDSDWSAVKVFSVCPMDINGDGDIAGSDRTIMATSWLAEEGDDEYRYYADINGDGEVSNTDRPFIGQNWNKEAGDDDLVYPRPVRAADAVFAAYESGDIDIDLNIF